jgi:hypothetical protein
LAIVEVDLWGRIKTCGQACEQACEQACGMAPVFKIIFVDGAATVAAITANREFSARPKLRKGAKFRQ